ncbi:YdgH/BhsA/McbA-like domain containing protein [Gilliamella mensalis]|uniref:YdgH/BhsA/McbA-like domain containing protein n=1 Tax=Gilliamella mensalis TaxID=1908520 RepID=UPI000A159277|nr:YdgH/BhsA/McbA-like domain containing protein [Gilliamella mensalis]
MKRFTKTSIALAVLLSLPVANLYAAQPLTAKESSLLVPLKEISVTGSYLQADNAADDISRAADEAGAKYYHITAMESPANGTSSDRAIVYANIYQSNAPIAVQKDETTYNGVVSYERSKALYYLPFEIVKFKGNYNNTSEITQAASKLAAEKNAYAFYIDSISSADINNQAEDIEVSLYKQEAPVRNYIVTTAIEGQDAYEISSEAFKHMTPYNTISFHGVFNNTADISAAAQKHAIANGAHFYYVKEVSTNAASTAQTVFVNLYK